MPARPGAPPRACRPAPRIPAGARPPRGADAVKTYEQLLCYWTPELGSNPAKVGLMSIPSKEIVRTRNLFNVTDAKLHWQSQSAYVCVKVDRHSKSKKSLATNLEIFRVREKGVPVEVIDTIKDSVINFAWEPNGDRFVLITTSEAATASAVPPRTSVAFFCPERSKGGATVGNFKAIRTVDKKNHNAIYWSPKGRFVVVATVHSQQSFDMDFWDLDFEGERTDPDKDLTANLQLLATADHYGVTDIDWDPTGRYVASSASVWKHTVRFDSSPRSPSSHPPSPHPRSPRGGFFFFIPPFFSPSLCLCVFVGLCLGLGFVVGSPSNRA